MSSAAPCAFASTPTRFLLELPDDLQLVIASKLNDPLDRARLSLAVPPLGLAAQAALEPYREWLFHLAMELASVRAVVDEVLLRRFAAQRRASDESMAWLNRVGALMCGGGTRSREGTIDIGSERGL